ncbi:MAG TPA: dynamin family protein, partial [Thiolinea sp.]|nr:dynamin family protein [Thiolinea sp.]
QDTLEHLVRGTQRRNDNSKFLFILNQIDTSAREDNLEDIVASWQKALVQSGLSAGSFHILFNDRLAVPVPDEAVWSRYVAKRDADYERIMERIDGVNVERVYRIIGNLESTSNQIEQQAVPRLHTLLKRWRRDTLIWDGIGLSALAVAGLALSVWLGWWQGLTFNPPWLAQVQASPVMLGVAIAIPLVILLAIHLLIRSKVRSYIAKPLGTEESYGNLKAAFYKSTGFPRFIVQTKPAGWGNMNRRRLDSIRHSVDRLVQRLNDRFTNPSGREPATPVKSR